MKTHSWEFLSHAKKNISTVRIPQQMVDSIIALLSCSMFLLLPSHIHDGLTLVQVFFEVTYLALSFFVGCFC